MSYTKNTTIWCDGEGCGQWVDGGSSTVAKARKRAQSESWTFKDDNDYCPVCSGAKIACTMCSRIAPEQTVIKDGSYSFCSMPCWFGWDD